MCVLTGAEDIARRIEDIDADIVVRRPRDLAGRDPGSHPENFAAGVMALPSDTQDVVKLVQFCAEHGIEIVPHGGRTGLVGGTTSAPGQLILSTERMNRILSLDDVDCVAVVQAGVTLEALQAAAHERGLEPGIDIGSRGSATIGGMASTNAGGIQAFRNGVMRNRILGLQAVMPDGSILDDMTTIVKSTSGYDVKQLLIGAEGTLGLVTRIAVKLDPVSRESATALVALPNAVSALKFCRQLHALPGCRLLAAEMIWSDFATLNADTHGFRLSDAMRAAACLMVVEISASDESEAATILEEALASHWEPLGFIDAIVARSIEQQRSIWHLREDMTNMGRGFPGYMSFDVSLPPSQADRYIQAVMGALHEIEPGLRAYVFGHIADGNLHVIPQRRGPYPEDLKWSVQSAIYGPLRDLGGSISAEHGIGTKKRDAYQAFVDTGKQALSGTLKRAFDPDRIFNPGKVVD